MTTALEETIRGLSTPLACQVIADIVGTEAGEHQWLSNGSVSKDKSIGHHIPTCCRSTSSRPPVAPIVVVLISLASLSLMLSSISLTLTCVAMTTSARQRRVGAAAEELALYKKQTKQTNNYSETRPNEAIVRGSAHRAEKKDTKTSSLQHPLSSFTASSRRLSDSKAASSVQSVPCQCTKISHVELGPPVAAHVSGGETDAGTGNKSDITKWQNKSGVSDKILCREGRLVALEGGLYAVYSQLYILLYPEEAEELVEDRADSFWHGVFRRHSADGKSVGKGEEAEELMRRLWTLTWRRDVDVVEVSSHLAGIFNLSPNDELTVRWSKSMKSEVLVDPDQKMTYFGMFKIQ